MSETETGDRGAFLGRIRERQGPPTMGGPHPAPPYPDPVPAIAYRSLDGIDHADPEALLPVFVTAVEAAHGTVEVVDGSVAPESIWAFVEGHEIRTAVLSEEPMAASTRDALQSAGVSVQPHTREAGAAADLAVTSATAAIAATGSVVVDAATAGSRAVSLLPRVHLCIVPLAVLVATPAEVLRSQLAPLPSCRVLITGPSRTGDIEQRLITGAHGPVSLHVIVVR